MSWLHLLSISWRALGIIKSEHNINLHSSYTSLKLFYFKFIQVEVVFTDFFKQSFQRRQLTWLPSNYPTQNFYLCFQVYFDTAMHTQYFLLMRMITLFSHEEVVVAQSDPDCWFNASICAKWLALKYIGQYI